MNHSDNNPWNPQPLSRARSNVTSAAFATSREQSADFPTPTRHPSNGHHWPKSPNGLFNGIGGLAASLNGINGINGFNGLDGHSSLTSAPGSLTRPSVNRQFSSDDGVVDELTTDLDQIINNANKSKKLIECLQREKESLEMGYRHEISKLQQDLRAAQNGNNDPANQHLRQEISSLKSIMTSHQFVMVLINGSSLTFPGDLMAQGDMGGREAARRIHDSVLNYLDMYMPDLSQDQTIMCRVYADFEHLANLNEFQGSRIKVAEFARGFTDEDYCEFVNVGSTPDKKIADMLGVYMHNVHCTQVFLGSVSHDNLVQIKLYRQRTIPGRITLLETPDANADLINLGYPMASLNGLLQNYSSHDFNRRISNGAPLTHSVSNPVQSNGQINGYGHGVPAIPIRKPSEAPSTSTEQSAPKPSPGPTWASTVQKAPNPIVSTPSKGSSNQASQKNIPATPEIERNRQGQRIDPAISHDKEEVNRVKNLKMCNIHFLRNECPYGDSCTHVHKYSPSPKELETLRLVARMAPCMHGPGCVDAKCIYGHMCPAPLGRNGQENAPRNCIFGDDCKFKPEMHRVDRKPVKTVKV